MNKIETKILNCFAVKEAEKNMVFAARLTQRGHIIHSMNDLMDLYNQAFTDETFIMVQLSRQKSEIFIMN